MNASESDSDANLSDIPTAWPVIEAAHQGGELAREAQERIVRRYGPAVLRYLLVLAKDVETASDLFQQFAKGLVEGRMRNAHPSRGKFRSYLKTTLVNLYYDHRRRANKSRLRFSAELPEPGVSAETTSTETERQFVTIWRNELLKQAFEDLQAFEKSSGRPYHTVLDLRMRHADARTQELAELYLEQSGVALNADRMRKLLFEARRHFADMLLKLVEETLDRPGLAEVEEELIELGLLEYCKDALKRRRSG